MKYWIIPYLLEVAALGLALFFGYMIILETRASIPNETLITALVGVMLGFVGYLGYMATKLHLLHYKALLKKHGIWDDEEIKKPSKKDGK